VEFGLFNALYLPHEQAHDPAAEHRRLLDEVTSIQAADRSGFKYTWASEHHFLTEYSHLSANESFLAFVAAKTERIHVGTGIFNITPPVNHPARVAERVAMIDHLSEGRFEFGMGRGSSSTEQGGFGITDPELTKEMFDEVVPQFARMWRDEPYAFDGRFFSMPERNVLPKPYTKPHPPMWVAAGNPGTFEKAARMGLGVLCFTSGSPSQLAPLIETYKKTIEKAEPVGDYVNNNIMVTGDMLCLEDGDRARRIFAANNSKYHTGLVFKYLDSFPRPEGFPVWPDLPPDPTLEELRAGANAAASCVGDPDEISKTVQSFIDIGADQLTFSSTVCDYDMDVLRESYELFGNTVIPRFDIDPVHSTTRQREEQCGASYGTR
jgi:alkanesulfonate monooxygenase SsuD/methylene tetrahydromethanopterin reductase-like flavin-dependent oxidoreductase (luciferase family)